MGLAQSVLAWFLGTSIEQSQVRTKTAAQLRSRFYILYNMLDHPAPHQIVVSHLYLGLKLDGRLPLAVTHTSVRLDLSGVQEPESIGARQSRGSPSFSSLGQGRARSGKCIHGSVVDSIRCE
jgi:hypothetical protein